MNVAEVDAAQDVEVDAQRVVLVQRGAEDGRLDQHLLRAAVDFLEDLADLVQVLGDSR